MSIHVASQQPIKIRAVEDACHMQTIAHDVESGVSRQPIGLDEIIRGANNRVDQLVKQGYTLCVAAESGIVNNRCTTHVVLHTSIGRFYETNSHEIVHLDWLNEWRATVKDDKQQTFGEFLVAMGHAKNASDWYIDDNPQRPSRKNMLTSAVELTYLRYAAKRRVIGRDLMPAELCDFNGVKFVDIQPLMMATDINKHRAIQILTAGLLFNKVIVIDARGFLFAGYFESRGYPIVMARKKGKLPGLCTTAEYKTEYNKAELSIQNNTIAPGDRCLVVDDVCATGGTFMAVKAIVEQLGGQIAQYISVYAVVDDNQQLICHGDVVQQLRYFNTTAELEFGAPKYCHTYMQHTEKFFAAYHEYVTLYPPKLCVYDAQGHGIPIEWGKFARSDNIHFIPDAMLNKRVVVIIDTADHEETDQMLDFLTIVHKKTDCSITVVLPFFEQATQDRIENKFPGSESLALANTVVRKINGACPKARIVTFDIHALQTQFTNKEITSISLMPALLKKYFTQHPTATVVFPDKGAKTRFGYLAPSAIEFEKERNGDVRQSRIIGQHDIHEGPYVVVDDMVRSGGTMKVVAQYLREHGAQHVDCLAVHGPFERSTAQNLAVFNDVWLTDTCVLSVPEEWVKIRCMKHALDYTEPIAFVHQKQNNRSSKQRRARREKHNAAAAEVVTQQSSNNT